MVHKSIPSQPHKELTECGFSDSAWCSITLNSDDHLLIGVCYRTTSSDVNNNEQILHLLNLDYGISASHLLLMGDFNLSEVDFVQYNTDFTEGSFHYRFLENTQDMFLVQQVTEATRYRERKEPSKLIFTNEG